MRWAIPTPNRSATPRDAARLKRTNARAGQPVDRAEWGINAQEVNAYYDPQNNEIVFPAAILQPPFFDYQADPASNYGAIGYVIGHEITHGFDITGSQFDPDGNLASWWTQTDHDKFNALQKKVVDQYSAIEVLPGLKLDGQIEVGENVADLGGIQNAYAALQTALSKGTIRARSTASPRINASSSPPRRYGAKRSASGLDQPGANRRARARLDPRHPAAPQRQRLLHRLQHQWPATRCSCPPDQRIVIW